MAPVPAFAASAAPAACKAEQANGAEAVEMAQRCDAEVTVTGSLTETDRLVANPSGTVTWEHQYRPVRVKRAGAWVPVNTELEQRADGSIGPKAAAVDVSFSSGGDEPMVTVADESSSLTLGSPLGNLPTPTLLGDTATYSEVIPGVDLQLRADVDGYSQVLVVKNAKAATSSQLRELTFATSGDNVQVKTDGASNLKVADDAGRTVFTGNTPLMWDNTTQAIAVEGAEHSISRAAAAKAKRVTMPVINDGDEITIKPSQKVIGDPGTTYPLYIDPGLTLNRFGFAVVNSAAPNTAFWNVADDAFVGSWDGGASVHRSFFSMDLTGSQLSGTQIVSAQLNLEEVYSSTCEPRQFEVWATGVPNENTTWNNQPEWYSQQSTSTTTKGNSAACPGGPVPMDVTNYMKAAADYGWNGVAFGIRATAESDWASWKRFANNPTLSVEYAPNLETATFGDVPDAGAASTLPQAYAAGAQNTAESGAAKDDFITKASEQSGIYYDPAALDYLNLKPTAGTDVEQAEMVVPKDYHVDEVVLETASYQTADGHLAEQTSASSTSTTDPDANDVTLPDGPGFLSFTPSGASQYILKTTRGEMLALWSKAKVKDDGSSTQDFWQYARKAKVEPVSIKNWPDWYVQEFGIKSYPATANPLQAWVDWEPKTGRTIKGDCNNLPLNLNVEWKGIEIGTSFIDCDNYTAYMRNDSPGDFSVNWNTSSAVPGAWSARESAFTWMAARKQPSTSAAQNKMTVNDYQYFRMKSPWFGGQLCDSTNVGKTC